MAEIPDLWWSPTVGVIQKLDGGWRGYGGGSEQWWGLTTAEPFPADAVQLGDRNANYLDRLGRQQLDEVMVALGPLYNDERHSWNVGTLARKAATDLAGGTRTDYDAATIGALARLVLAMDKHRVERDAQHARIAELEQQTTSALVRRFHEAFGVAVDAEDSGALRKLRNRLLHEEYSELRAELNRHPHAPGKGDLTAVAKELADLVYVAHGTAISLGIDLDEAIRRVHASNMSKRDPDGTVSFREDGKVLKPSTYRPPDMTGVTRPPAPVTTADQAFPEEKP